MRVEGGVTKSQLVFTTTTENHIFLSFQIQIEIMDEWKITSYKYLLVLVTVLAFTLHYYYL